MKKLYFIIIALTFLSCGVQKMNVIPESSTLFKPELNQVSESEIGITLVSKETGQKYKAIKITKGDEVVVGYKLKEVNTGDLFINDSYTNKYDLYTSTSDPMYGIALPKAGGEALSFTTVGLNFRPLKGELLYSQTFVPVKEKDYFKQEFIYNGRVGDGIKFIYREYVDDYARPAFTQDLQYDLSDSSIIGFRGLRIEVINATNTNIEYKVLNYFDK